MVLTQGNCKFLSINGKGRFTGWQDLLIFVVKLLSKDRGKLIRLSRGPAGNHPEEFCKASVLGPDSSFKVLLTSLTEPFKSLILLLIVF